MELTQTYAQLSAAQEAYIKFRATGGYYYNDQGEWVKMSQEVFAKNYGVERKTLWNWQQSIPNFWKLVAEEADKSLLADVPNIYKAIKLKALKGDTVAAKFLLNQADHLKATLERQEHDFSGIVSLLNKARELNETTKPEVIEVQDGTDDTASGGTSDSLAQPS